MATLSIGRQSSCDIVVDDPTVSRRHATLARLGDDLFLIVDSSSTSGSFRFVEGEWKQFMNARLRSKDRLRLGAVETTIDQLMSHTAAPKPEPPTEPKPQSGRSTYVERDPATGQLLIRTR